MKSFKQFLTEANNNHANFRNEKEFDLFCKDLSKKLNLIYNEYEYYGNDDCEFYFEYKGTDYCLQFSSKIRLLKIINDDSRYIGELKKPINDYKNFNDLLKDAKK